MSRHQRKGNRPRYDRAERLSELLREIVAEELARIDDERLELLSVTEVVTDRELSQAVVHYSVIGGDDESSEVLAALTEHRRELQAAIGRQARLRRVPPLVFRPDTVVRSAARIEEILGRLDLPPDGPGAVDTDQAGTHEADTDQDSAEGGAAVDESDGD